MFDKVWHQLKIKYSSVFEERPYDHMVTKKTVYLNFIYVLFSFIIFHLPLSWRRPLSYRNQSTDLLGKSMDWFLYDNGLRHERVKKNTGKKNQIILQ